MNFKRTKTRFNIFQVVIAFDYPTLQDLGSLTDNELLKLMQSSNFPTQRELEQILEKGKFSARGESNNLSTFTDFTGQLEKDERSLPCWKIILKSRITCTPAVIKKYFVERLGEKEGCSIQVRIEEEFAVEKKEEYWNLINSEWYPGIIRKTIVEFQSLLEDAEVQNLIKQGLIKVRGMDRELLQNLEL